LFHILTGMSNH